MPSITTHYIFSDKVLEKYKELNDLIDIDTYHIFSQSHDYLFYYTFSSNKKRKMINSLGTKGHHKNTKNYLINIIKNIEKNNLQDNKEVLSYLYGSITHYCLDSIAHPYIFYKTGIYRGTKETFKYLGGHTKIEKNLDAYYYEKKYNKPYYKCNISKEIIPNTIFSKQLNDIIDKTYQETYNVKNVSSYYQKGIKHAKILSNLFIEDRIGIKLILYKIISTITHKKIHITPYSTHNKIIPDYLNLNHNIWYHPSLKSLNYTTSFDDLLNEANTKCIKIIKAVNKVLFENKNIKYLDNYILDIDYSTGLDLSKNKKMKYFE